MPVNQPVPMPAHFPTPSTCLPRTQTLDNPDLLHRIISVLDKITCKHCLVVSKAFYNQAGPMLYHTITLPKMHHLEIMARHASTAKRSYTTRSTKAQPLDGMPLLSHTRVVIISQHIGPSPNANAAQIIKTLFPKTIDRLIIDEVFSCWHGGIRPACCLGALTAMIKSKEIHFNSKTDDPNRLWCCHYSDTLPAHDILCLRLPGLGPDEDLAWDRTFNRMKRMPLRAKLVRLWLGWRRVREPEDLNHIANVIAKFVRETTQSWELYMRGGLVYWSNDRDQEPSWPRPGYSLSAQITRELGKDAGRITFRIREEWDDLGYDSPSIDHVPMCFSMDSFYESWTA